LPDETETGFAMKLHLAIRIGRWLAFVGFLAGLGTVLYFVIPPTPIWILDVGSDQFFRSVADGRFILVRTLQDEWQVRNWRDGSVVFSCAALPKEWRANQADFDGRWLKIAGRRHRIIDTHTGEEHSFTPRAKRTDLGGRDAVFSPDCRYLLEPDDFVVRLVDTHQDKLLVEAKINRRVEDGQVMEDGSDYVWGFTPDHRCFYLTIRKDGLLGSESWATFDLVKNSETVVIEHNGASSRSPDGKFGLFENHLWNLTSIEKLHDIKSMEGFAGHARFSADSKFLVSWREPCPEDDAEKKKNRERAALNPQLPEPREMWRLLKFWDVSTGRLLSQSKIPSPLEGGDHGRLCQGKFSPDGKSFAFFDSGNETVGLWDIAAGKELWQKASVYPFAQELHFSQQGRSMLLLQAAQPPNKHPDLVVVDSATGQTLWTRTNVIDLLEGASQAFVVPRGDRVLHYCDNDLPFPLDLLASWTDKVTGRLWGNINLEVHDIPTGNRLIRLNNCAHAILSGDGQTLCVATPLGEFETGETMLRLYCYDLPPPHRWEIILGVPAVVGLLVLAWRRWRRKVVAARSAPSVQPAGSSA
jgi:hypothetical protein